MLADKSNIPLFVGGILVALSLLFPPWAYTFQDTGISQVRKPASYHFLFAPPAPEDPSYPYYGIVLDWSRLVAQIGVIGLVAGGTWFALRHSGQSEEAD